MAETFGQKLKNEVQAFTIAPVFPFLQRDWPLKMWLFFALAYVPLVNIIVARGWRMNYIRRLGWREQWVLPNPRETLKFFGNGLLLWCARGAFLLVPLVIIMTFGIGGAVDLWGDIVYMAQLSLSFFWERALTTREFLDAVWTFTVTEFIHSIIVFFIENIWLFIYIPIYRIGMIRFALTGKLLRSHLQVVKNLKFLFRNFIDIVLMYAFNVFNFVLIFLIDTILAWTVVGVPLIPIVTFYMYYWNTGYEYGLLARVMVEQEEMVFDQAPIVSPEIEAQAEQLKQAGRNITGNVGSRLTSFANSVGRKGEE